MIDDQLRGGFIRYINRTFTEFVLQPGRLKQVAGKGISMGNTVWKTTQIVDLRYIGAARANVGYRPAGGGILSFGLERKGPGGPDGGEWSVFLSLGYGRLQPDAQNDFD